VREINVLLSKDQQVTRTRTQQQNKPLTRTQQRRNDDSRSRQHRPQAAAQRCASALTVGATHGLRVNPQTGQHGG